MKLQVSGTPPAAPQAALSDIRTDFNVVFIHSRLDDYGLPPPVFRIYAHIARRAGNGDAYPAIATMARTCLVHPQTARRAVQLLTKHGLITREPRPGTTPIYRLTPASQWHPPTHISGNPSTSDTPPKPRQATPAKPMQGHPSESDGVEGNPLGGNPLGGNPETTNTTRAARGVPRSESEALEVAKLLGIPEDFARTEFDRMEGVGWLDGCQRRVQSWSHYLKQRWSKEQSERTERRATGRAPGRPQRPADPPRQFANANYNQDPTTL